MSDEYPMFTSVYPTEPGHYWWLYDEESPPESMEVVFVDYPQFGFRRKLMMWRTGEEHGENLGGLFGPRIPTPEQCHEINNKPA